MKNPKLFLVTGTVYKAAKLFIEDNQHHLRKPFVYAESLSRNPEMIAVRNHLIGCIRRES